MALATHELTAPAAVVAGSQQFERLVAQLAAGARVPAGEAELVVYDLPSRLLKAGHVGGAALRGGVNCSATALTGQRVEKQLSLGQRPVHVLRCFATALA